MVNLMLESYRQQSLSPPGLLFSVQVQCLDHYSSVTTYIGGIFRNRKATFFFVGFTFGMKYDGIDRYNKSGGVVPVSYIDYDNALVHADLGAASPIPGASYMVSAMSSANARTASVMMVIGADFFFRSGFGYVRIVRIILVSLIQILKTKYIIPYPKNQ